MANAIVLKRRIGSIKSTRQITKALQLVSASKMRRAQEYAMASRAYHDLAEHLLTKLSGFQESEQQPLFKKRPVKTKLYIVITSNSGLAGAYNSNVLKKLSAALLTDQSLGIRAQVIVIGNKGAQFVRRLSDVELVAVYNSFNDRPTANDVRPILNTLISRFEDESIDAVDLIYTLFKSNIVQEATIKQVLPAVAPGPTSKQLPAEPTSGGSFTNFEPDPETVIAAITTRLVEAQIWQALLESLASEHSMRMLAMKNATDNAKDLIDDYTLELNTARQAAITQELAEITGGAEALNG